MLELEAIEVCPSVYLLSFFYLSLGQRVLIMESAEWE